MLALWILITFAILLFMILFLLWRLRNCKCSLYETFESSTETPTGDVEKEDTAGDSKEADESKENEADVEVKKASKEVVEKDEDDTTMDSTETKPSVKKTEPKKKESTGITDKFMDYSEMKIFDSLRDNKFSFQDIKRMIREGEINEKMIEKFLARVEKMEDRVQSKAYTKTTVEGFAGNNYASAFFN